MDNIRIAIHIHISNTAREKASMNVGLAINYIHRNNHFIPVNIFSWIFRDFIPETSFLIT